MRVFVTGARGQLGFDTVTELWSRGHETFATDILPEAAGLPEGVEYIALDITDAEEVRSVMERVHPDAVIHCAAWTAVNAAEEPETREKVFAINVGGTRNIAIAARDMGCKMLYISTDYVFDGQGTEPWDADCTSFAPLNVYGESKLMGEEAVRELVEKHFIVRIAWVFGKNGNNFVKTILRVCASRDKVRVVNDQIGTPTYTPDLAQLIVKMVLTEKYGTYHATNEGNFISWYVFAREICRLAGYKTEVLPVTSEEYGLSKAKRPFNSRLSKEKLTACGFEKLPTWQNALVRFLNEAGVQCHE
ncbi:MAG: dTDP-4-dehydrorhamnose reductase [Clostridia bacterium]|nr:dTDP-4-dehydrorhamnose reductase [Clostridia bacterium]